MSTRRAVPAVLAIVFAFIFFGLGNYLAARQNANSERADRRAARGSRPAAPARPVQTAGTAGRSIRAAVRDGQREPRRDRRRREARAAGGDGAAAAHAPARSPRTASSSSTRTTTTARATTAPPATSATATSSPSSTASSRSARKGCRIRGASTPIKLTYKGRSLAARVVDVGDARAEVDPGDWAIVKVKEPIDLPALHAEPGLRVRLRRSDLPAGQRLLEGDHPRDRLRRAADPERTS